MRTGTTLNYLLSDQLGSTSITTDANGVKVSELRYKPWGETRFTFGTTPTKYTYTGQYSNMSDFGLMFYNARWYDPAIGRFAQADSVVPDGGQGYDRYAYVDNNPIGFADPTGHCRDEDSNYKCNHIQPNQQNKHAQEAARRAQLAMIDQMWDHRMVLRNRLACHALSCFGLGGIVARKTSAYDSLPATSDYDGLGSASQDGGPDWREWFGGGIEALLGVIIFDSGALFLLAALGGEHAAGVAGAPGTFGLSEFFAIIHTPGVIGLGGSIMAVGGAIAWQGGQHMWHSGVLQWSFDQITEPFK